MFGVSQFTAILFAFAAVALLSAEAAEAQDFSPFAEEITAVSHIVANNGSRYPCVAAIYP